MTLEQEVLLKAIAASLKKVMGFYEEYRNKTVMGEGALRGVEAAIFAIAQDMQAQQLTGFSYNEFLKDSGIQ